MQNLETKKGVCMSSVGAAADIGLKSVLIASDFSEASLKPLAHALSIARHFGAKFYFANVVSHVGYAIAGPEALKLSVERTLQDAQELEQKLLESGALAGLQYEFLVREGDVWEQLEQVMQEKQVDLVVLGTHGREGLGKLLLGSVAEQIFRRAGCFVVTVGPGSYDVSLVEKPEAVGPFLFATDLGTSSLRALPHAASFANYFGAKLVVLHVLPAAPIPEGFHWSSTGDLAEMRKNARTDTERRLKEVTLQLAPTASEPEFMVEFGIPSDQILLAAHALKADLILFGLQRHAHAEAESHLPWDVAYKLACGAPCPVVTIRD